MAVSATCPSCKSSVTLPPAGAGGKVVCPNPQCGYQFAAPAIKPGTAAARLSGSGVRPAGAVRPSALDKLPSNAFASPAFIAGGAAVALVYGVVLFAVLSSQKRNELIAQAQREAASHVAQELPAPVPEPVVSKPIAPAPSVPQPVAVEKREALPAAPPAPAPAVASVPKPETKPVGPVPATPEPSRPSPAVAAVEKPAAVPPPIPRTEPPAHQVGAIGALLDPDHDCQVREDPDGVTLTIPGTPHILNPVMAKMNAPRILSEVAGDFVAEVKVAGRIQPGAQPLPNYPFTFQGAGLLLWQDGENYLRLERSAINSLDRPLAYQVLVETSRDGKVSSQAYPIKDRPITLRAERRGGEVNCTYSPDGKTWIPVKNSVLSFANKVRVGVSASNLSPRPLPARFEGFSLDQSAGKAGRGRKS